MGREASANASSPVAIEASARWLAVMVLCLGVLMVVVDTTIVIVALPAIQVSLGFTQGSLVWVTSAYMLAFGGSLLLAGRLGDIFGPGRQFVVGAALFTLASVACGLANSASFLIAGRAVQGVGGAIVVAVALSLIMRLFTDRVERAKALGVYGFVCAGGGTIGLLAGGALTSALSWHWVFLVNLPVGVAVCAFAGRLLSGIRGAGESRRLDIWGGATVTASLVLANYAIVNGNGFGWSSPATLSLLSGACALLIAFLVLESRVSEPLVPLRIFRVRSLTISNVVRVLWATSSCIWSFYCALYLQLVLAYGPMQVAMVTLPASVATAFFALGFSAAIVRRFGTRGPLTFGLLLVATGLALLSRVPVAGHIAVDLLPGVILLGIGTGIAFNPLLIVAMSDVTPEDSGLASGLVNTVSTLGGALGLALVVTLCSAYTQSLLAEGVTTREALAGGYRVAFLTGAVSAAVAASISAAFLGRSKKKEEAAPVVDTPLAS